MTNEMPSTLAEILYLIFIFKKFFWTLYFNKETVIEDTPVFASAAISRSR